MNTGIYVHVNRTLFSMHFDRVCEVLVKQISVCDDFTEDIEYTTHAIHLQFPLFFPC